MSHNPESRSSHERYLDWQGVCNEKESRLYEMNRVQLISQARCLMASAHANDEQGNMVDAQFDATMAIAYLQLAASEQDK